MLTLAISLAASLSAASVEQPDPWDQPTPELVRDVEARIVMPTGANELKRYDRYYSFDSRDGRPIVVGLFLERRPEQSEGSTHRLSGPQRFEIDGGDCGIVRLTYDVEVSESPDVRCNGAFTEERRPARRHVPRSPSHAVTPPSR